MKRAEKLRRRVGLSVLTGLSVLLSMRAIPADAYETDTHFTLTYIICNTVGFTDDEALTVARFNQGMDDSDGTRAEIKSIPRVEEEILWHAIPSGGNLADVLKRKEDLFKAALNEPNPRSSLMRLGVFFHYQQDTWAHRVHPNKDPFAFTPFSTPFGHAGHGHNPDRPPFDPPCALMCLNEGIEYARKYLLARLRASAPPLLNDLIRPGAEVDENWQDARRRPLFNQLAADRSTPARDFLTDLIRSQIDAYPLAIDAVPISAFFLQPAPGEVDDEPVRVRLELACRRAFLRTRVPPRVPQPFLTTSMLVQTDVPLSRVVPGFNGSRLDWALANVPFTSGQLLFPRLMTDYTVRIKTAAGNTSGTDANVFLTINGNTDFPCGEHRLNWQIPGKPFQPNQTDTCILERVPEPIGEIKSITLRIDEMGADTDWLVEFVEVSAPGFATKRFTPTSPSNSMGPHRPIVPLFQ